MAVKQLSDGGPDGTSLGQDANDLVGVHGASPSAQGAVVATVSTTVPLTISSGFGFATSAQMIALIAAVNSITALLKTKGWMASS